MQEMKFRPREAGKRYIATYWRGNPQLENGGYETTRDIIAKNMTEARKLAKEYEFCVYGTRKLIRLQRFVEA